MNLNGHVIPQQEFTKEFIRKTIQLTIAFVPTLARWNFHFTVAVISLGIVIYTVNETARMRGRSDGIISLVTVIASRPTERGFVWGPVTLGLGALAALFYHPEPAATIGIYALAFGDGFASLAGLLYNRANNRVGEKALVESFLCFIGVFVSAYIVLGNLRLALISAAVAMGLELIPVQDVDNLIIPIGTGLALTLAM